jgi:cytochrome c5
MSDAPQSQDHDSSHDSLIKTPKQLIAVVLAAFLVPIFAIVLFVKYVTVSHETASDADAQSDEAIAARIQPVGSVTLKVAGDAGSARTGEEVFKGQCSACHAAGMLGAPKFGDHAAWAPRITQGFDALWQHALHGKNNMPPQGGGDYSDYEVARAVVYMANAGGAHFPEPPAPAGSAPEAAASTTAQAPAATAAPAVAATVAAPAPAPAAAAKTTTVAKAGEPPALFQQVCSACHLTGAAGAPKLGDKAAWAPRLAQGIDGLTANAIKGKNAMPPRGGSSATDAQIREVVTYMYNAAK